MLDRELCPRVDKISARDVCRLRRFESDWEAWRDGREESEDKPLGPDLESRWGELRRLIGVLPEVGATDDRTLTDIWQKLDAELGDRRCCPAARGADAAAGENQGRACPETSECDC